MLAYRRCSLYTSILKQQAIILRTYMGGGGPGEVRYIAFRRGHTATVWKIAKKTAFQPKSVTIIFLLKNVFFPLQIL
jgi:hypothetical protein